MASSAEVNHEQYQITKKKILIGNLPHLVKHAASISNIIERDKIAGEILNVLTVPVQASLFMYMVGEIVEKYGEDWRLAMEAKAKEQMIATDALEPR